jgi:hypothetical protein
LESRVNDQSTNVLQRCQRDNIQITHTLPPEPHLVKQKSP